MLEINKMATQLMILLWWSSASVIYYSFPRPDKAVIADVYINQLDEMIRKLAYKQPRLMNRDQPILSQDDARPHVAQNTLLKIRSYSSGT